MAVSVNHRQHIGWITEITFLIQSLFNAITFCVLRFKDKTITIIFDSSEAFKKLREFWRKLFGNKKITYKSKVW